MRIGNRIFPYPVLNHDITLSGYGLGATFELKFDGEPLQRNEMLVFKNLHYEINEPILAEMIEQEKINGAFIVECSASTFREAFKITSNPIDLEIPLEKFKGTVVASCYLYANEDISDFKSDNFLEEYLGYSFEIDKFDILAVDDGVNFNVETDPSQYDKVSSIFTIVKRMDDSKIMTYENREQHIAIYLPEEYYKSYEMIKTDSSYNNIAFAMFAIPTLTSCLCELGEIESISDAEEKHAWFKAVCISFKRVTGNELTCEVFNDWNKLELAQIVLNNATCTGINNFERFLLNANEWEVDNDE